MGLGLRVELSQGFGVKGLGSGVKKKFLKG